MIADLRAQLAGLAEEGAETPVSILSWCDALLQAHCPACLGVLDDDAVRTVDGWRCAGCAA